MEGNHFSDVGGVTKAKKKYFDKKLVISIFCQKQGPHVQRLRTHKNVAYVLFHAHVQMYET